MGKEKEKEAGKEEEKKGGIEGENEEGREKKREKTAMETTLLTQQIQSLKYSCR